MTSAKASVSRTDLDLAAFAGGLLELLRARRTRVHAITNAAAQTFTANLLLAAGAIPSLTVAADEVASFSAGADALLVNLGTLDPERRAAIPLAVAAAEDAGRPWVLDPVFVDASPPRLTFARELLARRPSALRCNGTEFAALAETAPTPESIRRFATAQRTVITLTGPVDLITDGSRIVSVKNGHPLMARVTAMGCAATALIAAFCALHDDAVEAAAAALVVTGVAGEIAGSSAQGPGSFQPAFLDALFALTPQNIAAHARLA